MISFIKRPTGGELPFLNLGGHDFFDSASAMMRTVKILGADELQLSEFRAPQNIVSQNVVADPNGAPLFTINYKAGLPLDEGLFLKSGSVVGKLKGLGITQDLLNRAHASKDSGVSR